MFSLAKLEAREGIWAFDAPEPTVGPNDVLIGIRKTSICGTDVHIYNWDAWSQRTVPVPMVTGHEYMGVVEAVGDEVRGIAVGDRVSGEGHITCGHCRNCRAGRRHLCRNTVGVGVNVPGAFTERFVLPASNVFKLPDAIPDRIGAILDPFGNAVHTALSFDLVGEDVLVTGAGPIGCMAAAVARFVGARHVAVTDPNPYRRGLAEAMGATLVVDPTAPGYDLRDVMTDLGMTEGFDVAFEMSGAAAALRDLLEAMNHGGRVAMLGVPSVEVAIDWNRVIFKGLVLKGIYGREMFETWYKMAGLIESGLDLDPIVTHELPVARFQEGFDLMRSGTSGKVVLDWGPGSPPRTSPG
ncbi:MAG: L-threonine 3-dehydrogenase [Trueperaceae bacterium]|nr:L-threonine 3-dehydrogenase [Trueperaceae bacterium]